MTRSKPLALLLGFGLAGLMTLGIQGYNAGSQAWPNGQALYYVNGANGDVSSSAARAAVQQGANVWHTQTNASFQFVYAGTTTADTVSNNGQFNVFFRSDSNGGAIASSYRWWNGAGEIVDSDIVFWDASNTFFTGSSGCSGGAYIEDVAAHEFGHSLGLGHSSTSGATMYPSYSTCSTGMRTLAADDIAGVESIYPSTGSTPPPSAPSSLTAAPNANDPQSKINLAWNDNSNDEDGFTIERALDGANFLFLAQNNANDSTYTDIGLSSGTTYWYRVTATNSGGESGASNIASAQTEAPAPQDPPNPPAGLSANLNGGSPEDAIDVSWNDMSGDEDSFTIERSMNGSSFSVVGQNNANDTTYTDSNLNSGTTYSYRVRAVNGGGPSAPSNVDSAQTSESAPPPPDPDPISPPSAPTNPSPAEGLTYVSRHADLAWSGDLNADSYDVYFGQSNPPPLHQGGVTTTSLNLSRLPRDKSFYWKVVAKNGAGSASSSVWSFSTGGGTSGSGTGGGGAGRGKGKKK